MKVKIISQVVFICLLVPHLALGSIRGPMPIPLPVVEIESLRILDSDSPCRPSSSLQESLSLPSYSIMARKARLQGRVVVDVKVAPDGSITDALVMKGLPMGLGEAARDAVLSWRLPSMWNEACRVADRLRVTFFFQLVSLIPSGEIFDSPESLGAWLGLIQRSNPSLADDCTGFPSAFRDLRDQTLGRPDLLAVLSEFATEDQTAASWLARYPLAWTGEAEARRFLQEMFGSDHPCLWCVAAQHASPNEEAKLEEEDVHDLRNALESVMPLEGRVVSVHPTSWPEVLLARVVTEAGTRRFVLVQQQGRYWQIACPLDYAWGN